MILGFWIGFLEISWSDMVDVSVTAILLYQLYRLVRGMMAWRIFFGFLVLYFVFLVVKLARLELLSTILDQFAGVGVLAAIILFQPEIRRFLVLLGNTTTFGQHTVLGRFLQLFSKTELQPLAIDEIVVSLSMMAKVKTGALIVLSKDSRLEEFTATGDALDALVSRRLLLSIFEKNGPMHDGAVIIHQNRILAARCILPVSDSTSVSAQFGTRHRAALGISEQTNVLVLVVSEETGNISLVQQGVIKKMESEDEVRRQVIAFWQSTTSTPDPAPAAA